MIYKIETTKSPKKQKKKKVTVIPIWPVTWKLFSSKILYLMTSFWCSRMGERCHVFCHRQQMQLQQLLTVSCNILLLGWVLCLGFQREHLRRWRRINWQQCKTCTFSSIHRRRTSPMQSPLISVLLSLLLRGKVWRHLKTSQVLIMALPAFRRIWLWSLQIIYFWSLSQ